MKDLLMFTRVQFTCCITFIGLHIRDQVRCSFSGVIMNVFMSVYNFKVYHNLTTIDSLFTPSGRNIYYVIIISK